MIADFHTHIYPAWLRDERAKWVGVDATFGQLYADPSSKLATAEELVAAMDQDGVDVSVAMGMGWTDAGLARESNDYIVDAVRRFPDRIVGFCSINPAWGAAAASEVDRCARLGLAGVGELHPDTQGFDIGDPVVMGPLMEVANDHGLTITTHTSEPVGHMYQGKGQTTPGVLMRFIEDAQAYSNVRIICAHWGGGLPFYALMPEVREALTNVWFDSAASPFLYAPDIFSTVARLIGGEKVLSASDFPLIRFQRIRGHVEQAGMALSDIAVTSPVQLPSTTSD